MEQHNKKTLIFLFPGAIYRPLLPDFKDRFEMLSNHYGGLVLTRTWDDEYARVDLGDFEFRAILRPPSGVLGRVKMAVFMIQEARRFSRARKADYVVCYDPMFTGVVGVILKLFLSVKVIVEINSDRIGGAVPLFYGKSLASRIKDRVLRALTSVTLFFCDAVRVLNPRVALELKKRFPRKKVFCFHDFVPTDYFQDERPLRRDILFVGYPFLLKGVDLLIQAFDRIRSRYPEVTLRMIGHRLREEAQQRGEPVDDPRKVFHKGMFYDELREYVLSCYCLVLPSRTEGMGRVLIEAMASGKPVIGSNAGGIPGVIEDGRNGFIFESENADDLADKLERLLSDPDLARRMGEESRKVVEEKFSSQKYLEAFTAMIEAMNGGV